MLERERVHVARPARLAHAGGVAVDEEARLAVALGLGDDDQVVGDVGVGHEPLLAADAPAAVDAPRDGLEARDVRARVRLGDRVGVAPLAAALGLEEARALRRRAVLEHLGGRQTQAQSAFVTRPSCSSATTCCRIEKPWPPHSAGMFMAFRPASSTAWRMRA